MNLLVVCPHFDPDVAPTGVVMSRIAHELIARGHRLHVVTSLPWYQHHAIDPGWEGQLVRTERTEWGCISRVHPFPTDKRNIPARALAFGGFTALATIVGTFSRVRPDAVLAMSPPGKEDQDRTQVLGPCESLWNRDRMPRWSIE